MSDAECEEDGTFGIIAFGGGERKEGRKDEDLHEGGLQVL